MDAKDVKKLPWTKLTDCTQLPATSYERDCVEKKVI